MLRPTFALTIGSLRSTSDSPVAGPRRIVIARAMDVAADGAELWLAERGGVTLGDALTVELGHDGDQQQVFSGSVVQIRPAIQGLLLRAVGSANSLLTTRAAGYFENQTAAAIIRDLAGRAGVMIGSVDEGPLLPRFAVDSRLSVYAHLRDLAERLGCEIYADREGKLHLKAFGGAGAGPAGGLGGLAGAASALAGAGGEGYSFGQHLLAATADARTAAWGTVDIGGESPVSGQGNSTAHWLTANDSDYRGSAGDGEPGLLLLDPLARTKDLADQFAQGRLTTALRRTHTVEVTVLGRPGLELGDTISVAGLADELVNVGGYIRAIRHSLDDQRGFVSTLRVAVA